MNNRLLFRILVLLTATLLSERAPISAVRVFDHFGGGGLVGEEREMFLREAE